MRILIEIDAEHVFSGREQRVVWGWLVRQRAGFECEECGSSERLHSHHIDRDQENSTLANGQCLCQPCHVSKHWSEDAAYREKMTAMSAARWSDPESRARTMEASKRGIYAKTTPESRSEATKRAWATRRARAAS